MNPICFACTQHLLVSAAIAATFTGPVDDLPNASLNWRHVILERRGACALIDTEDTSDGEQVNFWRSINNAGELRPIGSRESDILDFKGQGYGNTDSDRYEAARDVAQFANQLGGTIILGAQEENGVLKEYAGLPEIADQRTKIRDICATRIESSLLIDLVEIDYNGRKVLAVNVTPSLSAVGVRVSTQRYEFPIRRNDRKDFLTLQEVAMMGTPERRGRLLLESIPQNSRAKLRMDTEKFDYNKRLGSPSQWQLEDIRPESARFKVWDISVYIPLAFIEAVWPSDSYGEYTVSVRACLRLTEGAKKIEVSMGR